MTDYIAPGEAETPPFRDNMHDRNPLPGQPLCNTTEHRAKACQRRSEWNSSEVTVR
jgi:hypothetical protein